MASCDVIFTFNKKTNCLFKVVVITITMIVVNIGGLMYWWGISLNAVSLVNLVSSRHFNKTTHIPRETGFYFRLVLNLKKN